MSVHGDPLHDRLRGYKDGGIAAQRNVFALQLAVLLDLFFEHHADCLGGQPQAITTVRSASRDAPARIVELIRSLRELHIPLGWDPEQARPRAGDELRGKRVLLIDDTFTQGRSIAAACRALRLVGAEIMTPLVIGRHFHPNFPTSKPLYACLREHK